ncbi:MAG: class I SAM-dependent methyltransferase [Chloroflexi bacterium]|nr:class I SAM-dependent methyltransferase [Chloroflexota bacterium]
MSLQKDKEKEKEVWKRQVRDFYDSIGWQMIDEGVYQNARFEDLRPVSREYIHRAHLRVKRYLKPTGRYLLDAGSGPVQYPEYLTYSEGYRYRVCADISIQALKEARRRLGDRGLYVVADVAHLPFASDVFDGVVSLHTIHHLPYEEHAQAYRELYRVLKPGATAVVVNGWRQPALLRWLRPIIWVADRIRWRLNRLRGHRPDADVAQAALQQRRPDWQRARTLVKKYTADDLRAMLPDIPMEIYAWRALSVKAMRSLIHPRLGGRWLLRALFWLEDRFPRFFGEKGAYPLIVLRKEAPSTLQNADDKTPPSTH